MRLFVAVELPEALRSRLADLQDALRGIPLPVRWARPDGVHLTLKFLGEVAADRLPAVESALAKAFEGHRPFALRAAGLGVFPERGAPRVVWVGASGDVEPAALLQQSIDAGLASLGFVREERAFRPHLTLGRVKGPERGEWRATLARQAQTDLGEFEVRGVVLFESRLGPGGAVYGALRRFPLSGGGTP